MAHLARSLSRCLSAIPLRSSSHQCATIGTSSHRVSSHSHSHSHHHSHSHVRPCSLSMSVSSRCFSSSSPAASHILVLADHTNNKVVDATYHAISAATALKPQKLTVLVAGHNAKEAAKQVASIAGVTSVLHADHAAYEHSLAENVASLVVALQKKNNYSHIVTAGSSSGKNILPRAAVQLDVQPIGDVVEVKSADTFVRPIYAGNALSTVQSSDSVKLITVRTTAFPKAAAASSAAAIETESASNPDTGLTKWVSDELSVSARPELATARVVVSGGRGMKSGENFKMLEELADTLNGAVGASRAAVDAGFVPNDYQVGQTGKVVAPDLYIAVGISGAIQHLAGMKDSKTIVAINKDAEAPIFQVADYGLVADLFKAVPELTTAIKAAKSK